MLIDYKSWYDQNYWEHKKRYQDASGVEKTYFGPGLRWEGFQFVADALERVLPPRSSVLDIGCGGGDLLARLFRKDFVGHGVEISEYAAKHSEISDCIEVGDVTDPAFQEHFPRKYPPYRVLMATDFLEHVYEEDLERTFQFLYDIVLPRGIMFFLVAITTGEEFVAKKGEPIPAKWHETAVSGHVNVRRSSYWQCFFKERGLTIDWERMYKFQALRETAKPWKETAGWDMPFTYFLRK